MGLKKGEVEQWREGRKRSGGNGDSGTQGSVQPMKLKGTSLGGLSARELGVDRAAGEKQVGGSV